MRGKDSNLGVAATAAYASGSFGTGIFSAVPSILLLYFCTEVLRLPPAWAAGIVFAPKAWSIVWDPFVGAWSDRTATPIGRRRPFLIAGAAGVSLSFIALFSPPQLGVPATGIWVACAYFSLATLYSLFAVPYVAIPAEINAEAEVRARLVTWRMFVVMIGVLTGGGIVPLLVQYGGGGRAGYEWMALWVAAACAVAMCGPVFMLRGRDPARIATHDVTRSKLGRNLWSALSHRRFVRLICAYLLQLTAIGSLSAAGPYLVTGAFGRPEGDIGIAMLGMLVVATVTIPFWGWAGLRFGNARVLAVAVVGYGAAAALVGCLAWNRAPWAMALASIALLGLPFAALQVLPYTIVAQLIHDRMRDGSAAEGSFTGVWTATEKLGMALGPGLTGIVLSFAGRDVSWALPVFCMTGPVLLTLASVPLIRAQRA
jgi:Na+/melibiose symporter-like transporter